MFTGLVQDVGTIRRLERRGREARIVVETALDPASIAIGDSVAVDGACLTSVATGGGAFEAMLSEETLKRTAFSERKPGDRVNLEPALRLGDRLGGHLVQGHVDGVGRLVRRDRVGEGWDLAWELPEECLDTVVEKGSIALDGVSLTVARLEGRRVTVAVVAHTASATNLLDRAIGAPVHVETDLVGKYVRRLLDRRSGGGGLDLRTLEDAGFL